jgi:transposase
VAVSGEQIPVTFVDQGYTGEKPAAEAAQAGLRLEVVKQHEAKHGFVLLPRRGAVERSFAWAARLRRLGRDYERRGLHLAGYHWLAFALLILRPSSLKVHDRF